MHNTTHIATARPLQLVAVRTATGATTFIVTRRPDEQLGHLGRELEVDQRLVVATDHADEIAARIRSDLNDKRLLAQDGSWFGVDWETVLRLLGDFDLDTGYRIRLSDVSVGDEVWVRIASADARPLLSKSTVLGIVGRLYLVELHQPVGEVRRLTVSRENLKPHVSRVAFAEAA